MTTELSSGKFASRADKPHGNVRWFRDGGSDVGATRPLPMWALRGNGKVRSGVWRDLAVHHRKTEVDAQYGHVLAMAEARRYPMPMLRTLVELIHALEPGRIDRSLEDLETNVNA